jgi:hypothetical protein
MEPIIMRYEEAQQPESKVVSKAADLELLLALEVYRKNYWWRSRQDS